MKGTVAAPSNQEVDEFAHDRVPIRFHRIARALTVGLLGAFGVGVHRILGGVLGAAVPGALVGGAIGMLSGHAIFRNRQWTVAAAGALSFAVGAAFDFALLGGPREIGSIQECLLALGTVLVMGALWGLIGGTWIGLTLARAVSPRRLLEGIGAMLVGGAVAYGLHWVGGLGVGLGTPRMWSATLGAAIALAFLLSRWAVPAANGGAIFGALGFGLGAEFGRALHLVGSQTTVALDWGILGGLTTGFVGGAAMAWGIWLMGDLSKPIVRNPELRDAEFALPVRLFCWAVVFLVIPVGIVLTQLGPAGLADVGRQHGVKLLPEFVFIRRSWSWLFVALGLVTVRWAIVHSFERDRWFTVFPFIFGAQMFALAYIRSGLPAVQASTAIAFGLLGLCFLAAAAIAALLEPDARVFHLHPPRPTFRFVGTLALAAILVTIFGAVLVGWVLAKL